MDENYCFELTLPDGPTVLFPAKPDETMKEFGERIKDTTGVSIDISQVTIDGKNYGEDTSVMNYFATSGEPEGNADKIEDVANEATDYADPEIPVIFCCVPDCTSNSFGNVNFFNFPEQKKRRIEWILAINKVELLKHEPETLCQELAICENHFQVEDFENGDLTQLKSSAIPTVFTTKTTVELPGIESLDMPESIEESMIDNVVIKGEEEGDCGHPGSLCRLCAIPISDCPSYLFENDDGLANKINACLPISISKNDVLPKQICQVCVQRLELQHSFAESCSEAEKKLTTLARKFVTNGLKKCNRSGKNKQTHCCPLCCSGGMQYVNTSEQDGDENETHSEMAEGIAGLYSDDDDDTGASPDGNEPIETTAAPMDMVYLAEDRNFSLNCELCQETFMNAQSCRLHSLTHSSINYFPCTICGLVFESEGLHTSHFLEHKTKMDSKQSLKWAKRTCETCGIEVATRKDFILHKCSKPVMKTKQVDTELMCYLCGRMFTNSTRAQQHAQEHSDQSESYIMSCLSCDFQCSYEPVLDHHVSSVHANLMHTCTECGFRFMTEEHLEKHEKLHDAVTYHYQCSFCQRQFSSLSLINQHMKKHNSDTENTEKENLTCSKCSQQFSQRSQLQYHLESAHDSMGRMPSLIQYQCKLCSLRIKSSSEVLKHRTLHWKSTEPSLPFVCEYCGEAHSSPNALARHRRYLHPDDRPYVCTICDHATRTLYEARVHRTTHTGASAAKTIPVFQCEHCPEVFTDKASFVIHKKTHKLSKWYKCDSCDKSFPERHRLATHRRLHTGEKPFTCGTCGKKFSQTSAMYTHALLHTGEKPHNCDICHRRFRIKSDRDNHRRKHTGEKPFKCQYCGKTFRTGQVFYQHRMIHTGERRFPCDICGRAFKRSHTLACHRRIHTGEKPNICDVCGKGFRQRTDMRKHKIHIHNIPA